MQNYLGGSELRYISIIQESGQPRERSLQQLQATRYAAAAPPLLEMAYHEGCPGCAVERSKALNSGVPYMRFFHIWIIILVSCMCLSPYVFFLLCLFASPISISSFNLFCNHKHIKFNPLYFLLTKLIILMSLDVINTNQQLRYLLDMQWHEHKICGANENYNMFPPTFCFNLGVRGLLCINA